MICKDVLPVIASSLDAGRNASDSSAAAGSGHWTAYMGMESDYFVIGNVYFPGVARSPFSSSLPSFYFPQPWFFVLTQVYDTVEYPWKEVKSRGNGRRLTG